MVSKINFSISEKCRCGNDFELLSENNFLFSR